jgi:hypothetical protein
VEAVHVGDFPGSELAVSIFARPPRGVLPSVGSNNADTIVRTENELRSAVGAVVASGSGYGKSITVSGVIKINSNVVIPSACAGLTVKGSGELVGGEFDGTLLLVNSAEDISIDGLTLRIPLTAVTQNMIYSTGLRTSVRNVRIVGDLSSLATVEQFNFTRQSSIYACTCFSVGAMGIRVSGVTAGCAVFGNDLSGLDINTSAGTYSTVVGNRNIGAGSSYDATDAVGLNT